MGMNYFAVENACAACGRGERRHIGKSSYGWTFGLHIYPEEGIATFADWRARLARTDVRIVDDLGAPVTVEDLMASITERRFDGRRPEPDPRLDELPGPNGLFRRVIDHRPCVGHGEGTWDYLVGYFS